MHDFYGANVAIIHNSKVLIVHRDDKPYIPYPNLWEFPGGGRENNESEEVCACREAWEEFAIKLNPEDLIWKKQYQADKGKTYFFVANITDKQVADITFGGEGQAWKFAGFEEILASKNFVDRLKQGFIEYLENR